MKRSRVFLVVLGLFLVSWVPVFASGSGQKRGGPIRVLDNR
jgi:hypothetical protein